MAFYIVLWDQNLELSCSTYSDESSSHESYCLVIQKDGHRDHLESSGKMVLVEVKVLSSA